MRLHDRRRPVQHLGRRIALGVDRAGLLELQRHLVGDREARARARARRPSSPAPAGRRAAPSRRRAPARTAPAAPPPPPAGPSSSRHSATSASAASTEATKVLVAATLCSGPASSGSACVAGRRHRRAGDVGDRHGQRPALAGAPHHLDDVRALPRLRDADADRAVEPQPPPVDRGDRRPDRGDRHPGRQLRDILQVGRRMVRRPARHRHQQPRVERPHRRRRRRHAARASRRGTAPPPPGSPRPRRSSVVSAITSFLPARPGSAARPRNRRRRPDRATG